MEALEVRRVSSSADLLHPGEYVFIAKRQPKITVERRPPLNPDHASTVFRVRLDNIKPGTTYSFRYGRASATSSAVGLVQLEDASGDRR
jgi:hypothetical protein